MEKHLEHKIEEAFQKKDASTNYPQKEELWSRISNAQKSKPSINRFWRVAAVFFAVLFISGAFAGLLFMNNKLKQLTQMEENNQELQVIIDSIQNIIPQTITEIKYTEKEVKIFVPVEKNLDEIGFEKEQIATLKQENIQLKNQLRKESKIWQNKSDSLMQELLALNKIMENKSIVSVPEKGISSPANVVELKPEKYEMPLQQTSQPANPKMRLQLFSNPDGKTNFDMNSTIFKK